MNTINARQTENVLEVTVNGGFNVHARTQLQEKITEEIHSLIIDFTNCNLIDSKGVVFLYRWQQNGKKLECINPPNILFEITDILELGEHWNITIRESN